MFSLSSYCDMNTLYCSQYRSYNKGIPFNLHDRHWEFVLHKEIPSNLHDRHWEFVLRCLERRKISVGSDLSGIFFQERGFFSKLSFTNTFTECHKVYFGNNMKGKNVAAMTWAEHVLL